MLAGDSSSSCLDELSISGVWPLECGFSRILERQHCAVIQPGAVTELGGWRAPWAELARTPDGVHRTDQYTGGAGTSQTRKDELRARVQTL